MLVCARNGALLELSAIGRIKTGLQFIKRTLLELNLYKSIPSAQDERILRQQRGSTRVYLFLLLTSLAVLTLFTSIRVQPGSVSIKTPSLSKFFQLYDQYSLTLSCPCSQPTVRYDRIISYLKPTYHQICSSKFISPEWIDVQFIKSPDQTIYTHDIRSQSQIHFQLLATLCYTAAQTVEDNLHSFYHTEFVTDQVLGRKSFQVQTDLIVEQFKRVLPESFQRALELIKLNFELNEFIVPVNSYFNLDSFDHILHATGYFQSESPTCLGNASASGCTCEVVSLKECYRLTRIVDNGIDYIIPGMLSTWFPFQSLLISTLECLYSDVCLSQIKAFINENVSSTSFTTLTPSSNFTPNATYEQVDVLARRLFVESWDNESSYESYFDQCNPLACQYTYQSRFSLIYIVTTVIGLIGGLLIVARLAAPVIVKFAHAARTYISRWQQNGRFLTAPSRSTGPGKKRSTE